MALLIGRWNLSMIGAGHRPSEPGSAVGDGKARKRWLKESSEGGIVFKSELAADEPTRASHFTWDPKAPKTFELIS